MKGAKDVFAIGDCTTTSYAPTAQVASQQEAYLARVLHQLAKKSGLEKESKKLDGLDVEEDEEKEEEEEVPEELDESVVEAGGAPVEEPGGRLVTDDADETEEEEEVPEELGEPVVEAEDWIELDDPPRQLTSDPSKTRISKLSVSASPSAMKPVLIS